MRKKAPKESPARGGKIAEFACNALAPPGVMGPRESGHPVQPPKPISTPGVTGSNHPPFPRNDDRTSCWLGLPEVCLRVPLFFFFLFCPAPMILSGKAPRVPTLFSGSCVLKKVDRPPMSDLTKGFEQTIPPARSRGVRTRPRLEAVRVARPAAKKALRISSRPLLAQPGQDCRRTTPDPRGCRIILAQGSQGQRGALTAASDILKSVSLDARLASEDIDVTPFRLRKRPH